MHRRRLIRARQSSHRLHRPFAEQLAAAGRAGQGFFARNGIQAELVLLTSQLSAVALNAGELQYVAGVGPGSVSATLAGSPSRAVWIVANRMIYSVIAQPELKTLQDLRGKRIGVSGLGATTHTAFTMAVEKAGANPKDFVVVGLGPQQHQRAMESKAVDAIIVDPPVLFVLLKKGFNKVLDIGAAVEMPVGGLTTLTKTLTSKSDQVLRVIKALQQAKESLIGSRTVRSIHHQDHEHGTRNRGQNI